MRILFVILIILSLGACSEEKVGVYSLENSYVYFVYDKLQQMGMVDSMFYVPGPTLTKQSYGQTRDTIYYRVGVVGLPAKIDRKIEIETFDYEIDGTKQAVAGVNYIGFDAPEMEKYLVIPADSLGVTIPIVLTYDESTFGTYQKFVVAFRLVETEDFKLMDPKKSYSVLDPLYRGQVRFSQSAN